MANMSYCRYSNTLKDLRDLTELLDGDLDGLKNLSKEERSAAAKIISLAWDIAEFADSEGGFDDLIDAVKEGVANEL